jgi:hypothetical protein
MPAALVKCCRGGAARAARACTGRPCSAGAELEVADAPARLAYVGQHVRGAAGDWHEKYTCGVWGLGFRVQAAAGQPAIRARLGLMRRRAADSRAPRAPALAHHAAPGDAAREVQPTCLKAPHGRAGRPLGRGWFRASAAHLRHRRCRVGRRVQPVGRPAAGARPRRARPPPGRPHSAALTAVEAGAWAAALGAKPEHRAGHGGDGAACLAHPAHAAGAGEDDAPGAVPLQRPGVEGGRNAGRRRGAAGEVARHAGLRGGRCGGWGRRGIWGLRAGQRQLWG